MPALIIMNSVLLVKLIAGLGLTLQPAPLTPPLRMSSSLMRFAANRAWKAHAWAV